MLRILRPPHLCFMIISRLNNPEKRAVRAQKSCPRTKKVPAKSAGAFRHLPFWLNIQDSGLQLPFQSY